MMATLRRFMTWFSCSGVISAADGSSKRSKILNFDRHFGPKRKPGQKTGHTFTRCGAIYSGNAKKQWVVWRLVNRIFALSIAFLRRRIDPAQHFLEMALDRVVAKTGALLKRISIAHHDGAAPRLQNALGLEGLDHPAGIGAADAKQRRELLVCQWHDVGAFG